MFWMEQAEVLEAGEGSAMALIEPSIRKEPHEFWFSWNPMTRDGWCWQRFMAHPEPDDVILKVSWRDNPWWSELPSMQKLRLRDKRYEPQLYDWKWEGLPLDGDADTVWLPHNLLEACVRAYQTHAPAVGGRRGGLVERQPHRRRFRFGVHLPSVPVGRRARWFALVGAWRRRRGRLPWSSSAAVPGGSPAPTAARQ